MQESVNTLKHAKALLDEHGRYAMLRPTGFGKTYNMAQIMREHENNCFVYPLNIIKQAVDRDYPYITENGAAFVSYSWISRNGVPAFLNLLHESKIDLVTFDELQYLGADKIYKDLDLMKGWLLSKGIKYGGGTATPLRMDMRDIVSEFFDDIVTYPFGIHDAIQAGVLQKFHYVYGAYDSVALFDEVSKRSVNSYYRINPEEVSNLRMASINLWNMPEILFNGMVDAYDSVPSYIKMLVFLPGLSAFENNIDESYEFREAATLATMQNVIDWYKCAFTDHKVNYIAVSSNPDHVGNIRKLDSIGYKKNAIDLIFSVNMLNLGYHVEDVTGLTLLRGTNSNSLYGQQMGRAFSAKSKHQPIIYDFVGNLDRYSLLQTGNGGTRELSAAERLYKFEPGDYIFTQRSVDAQAVMKKLSNYYGEKLEYDISVLYNSYGVMVARDLARGLNIPLATVKLLAAKLGLELKERKVEKELQDVE